MTFIRVKEEERIRKEKARKVPILNLDFQHQNRQVKKDMVIPGNDMIGTLILLMILRIHPQKEPLRGMVRNTPHGWHQFPCTRCSGSWLHTVKWDQERQSEGSRNMHCIKELRQSFAVATKLSCLPTLR